MALFRIPRDVPGYRYGAHRKPRSRRHVFPLPAAFGSALLISAVGAGSIGWAGPVTPPSAPRACSDPYLPSGDVKANPGGREYVCTDGTWVRVSGYGLAAHVTPADEARACAAVTAFHARPSHRGAIRALSAAGHADRELQRDITRYVRSGHGWSRVYGDCNPDA